uniref:VRR-NUC domain-containing protein n=1 Tax=Desulfovibrio sp. U5L TaxID=596152 RepID=I2Q042_9BACT
MPRAHVAIAEIRAAGGLKPWLDRELARGSVRPLPVVAKNATAQKPARPKPAKRSEHEEQALVVARAEALAPSVPELRMLFAIPNGGHRHKAVAGKLKDEGVRRGVPDLCLAVPCESHHGLWIEMKAAGGRASDEQETWIGALRAQGYRAEVCVGADAAWGVICEYLGIRGVMV